MDVEPEGKEKLLPRSQLKEMETIVPKVNGAWLDPTIYGAASPIEVFQLQPHLNMGLNGVGNHQVCDLQLAAKAFREGEYVFLNYILQDNTPPQPTIKGGSLQDPSSLSVQILKVKQP
jgi:hypothetical protein